MEKEKMEKSKRAAYDMLYLVACGLNGQEPDRTRVIEIDLQSLYSMCRFHSLDALVFMVLEKSIERDVSVSELMGRWKEKRDKAVRKNILLDCEREKLFSFCREKGIWYLPLKGIVLKELYPQMGMRQMADNDILFDRIFQEEIYQWFVRRGYEARYYQTGSHDCYYKKPVYNFEMHTTLFDASAHSVWADYYRNAEARLLADEENFWSRRFTDEDFYVYITCHGYKHFCAGGTGLRTLTDVFVYLKAKEGTLDWKYISEECKKLGIAEYERMVRGLVHKIFSLSEQPAAEELTESERNLLEIVLLSGTYGTFERRIRNLLHQIAPEEEKPSFLTKGKYFLWRMFPDDEFMDQWTAMYCRKFCGCTGLYPFVRVWRILYKGRTMFRKMRKEIQIVLKS